MIGNSSGSHLSSASSTENAAKCPAEYSSSNRSRFSFYLRTIAIDILLAGIAICIFAVFHHVIPTLQTKGKVVESISTVQTVTVSPSPEPLAEDTDSGNLSEIPDETPVEDTRTEWQKKFEDKFTDGIIVTDNHYSSPNICIDITSDVYMDEYERATAVYVADIYIGSIECFQTYFAGGKYISSEKDDMDNMIEQSGAILAANGDFANLYTSQETFLVRNGEVFFTGKAYMCDICVLNSDGTMDAYTQKEFNAMSVDDILAKQPYNSWRFGPSLLDSEGHAREYMNLTSDSVMYVNPRCAIGYYEPGHYCLITCDGRSDEARGLSIWELAEYCESLGCKAAYNLDGGASAMMKFNGNDVNVIAADWRTNEERLIGDIVLIKEPEE